MGKAGNDWIYRKKIIKEFKIKKSSLASLDKLVKEEALTYKQYYEALGNASKIGERLKNKACTIISTLSKSLADFAEELDKRDLKEAQSGTENK